MDGSDPSGLDDWLDNGIDFIGNGCAGFGAAYTGGLTQHISDAIGNLTGLGPTGDMVNKCSSAYVGGSGLGLGAAFVTSDEDAVVVDGVEGAGEAGRIFESVAQDGDRVALHDGYPANGWKADVDLK